MRKNAMRLPVVLIVVGLVLLISALFQTKFDFTRFAEEEYEMKTQTILEPFDRILAETADLNVILTPAPDGVCVVEYPEGEKLRVTVKTENGALVVSQERLLRFPFNIMPTNAAAKSVQIRLSERAYSALSVKTGSGDISVSDAFTFQSAETRATSGNVSFAASAAQTRLEATSGNISVCGGSIGAAEAEATSGKIFFENVRAASIDIKSTSANICLENTRASSIRSESTSGNAAFSSVSCEGTLEARTTSGTMDFSDVCCNALSAHSASGCVRAGNAVCDSSLAAVTTSGDIRLVGCDAGTVSIESTSGSVDARLLTPKRVTWKTASGSVSVPDDADGEPMNVTTTSGSIRVSFGE